MAISKKLGENVLKKNILKNIKPLNKRLFYFNLCQNFSGKCIFSTSTAFIKSGATSLGFKPANPQPTSVTKNIKSFLDLANSIKSSTYGFISSIVNVLLIEASFVGIP
jgi:hypothetical protein